jgi:hypothetical protein
MTPDDQPYCGVELLPHATFPDGSPAPTLCDRRLHGPDTWHGNEELGTCWQWQDKDGNFAGGTGAIK